MAAKCGLIIEDTMKTAIFIDGANTYTAARALGFDIDYDRVLAYFNKDKSLLRAFYYTAVLPDPEGQDKLRPLVDWLSYNGYKVVTKMAKVYTDRMGMPKTKGNMDMEMAVDALLLADKVDNIVIFSGDGDFSYLVHALQQKAVRVTVVSTIVTQPPFCADELRRAADLFLELNNLQAGIGRGETEGRRRSL